MLADGTRCRHQGVPGGGGNIRPPSVAASMPKFRTLRCLLSHAALVVTSLWVVMASFAPAHATVVISNTPVYSDGGSGVIATDWKALIFTSGSTAARINSIAVGLNPWNFSDPLPAQRRVELALFTVVGGVPDRQIATTGLLTVDILQRRQMYTFNTGPDFSLAAWSQYAIVVRSDATGIKWGSVGDTNTAEPVASGGYAFNGFKATETSGANWNASFSNSSNAIVVDVTFLDTPIPTLSEWAMALLALLMGAGVVWRSARPSH